jgi:hypothetical protein
MAKRAITILLATGFVFATTSVVIAEGGAGGGGSASKAQYCPMSSLSAGSGSQADCESPCPDDQIAVDIYCCPRMHEKGTWAALVKDKESSTGAFCLYSGGKGKGKIEAEKQAHLQKDAKKPDSKPSP